MHLLPHAQGDVCAAWHQWRHQPSHPAASSSGGVSRLLAALGGFQTTCEEGPRQHSLHQDNDPLVRYPTTGKGPGQHRCTRTLAPASYSPFLNPHARHSGPRGQPERSSLSLSGQVPPVLDDPNARHPGLRGTPERPALSVFVSGWRLNSPRQREVCATWQQWCTSPTCFLTWFVKAGLKAHAQHVASAMPHSAFAVNGCCRCHHVDTAPCGMVTCGMVPYKYLW
jgi:hypothetical protein